MSAGANGAAAPDRDPTGMLGDVDDRDAYRTEDAAEFDEATANALATPVNPEWCELKPAGGRELVYIPWIRYQEVLVSAFGRGGFRIVPHPKFPPRQVGKFMTYRGALMVRPRGTTRFIYVGEAVGANQMFENGNPGDATEGAMSDCLTKCCKRLHIFSEVFDPDWRRRYEAHFKREHQKDVAKPAPLPSNTGRASGNPPVPATDAGEVIGPARNVEDTGESATQEAYEAVGAQFKRLQFKGQGARQFLLGLFGVDKISALTAAQADVAQVLLLAWKTPQYEGLLARLRAEGKVRS